MIAHWGPDFLLLVPLLDDACGTAYGDALGRDVVGDSDMAADDAAISNGNSWQDGDKLAKPDIGTDNDGFTYLRGTLVRRYLRAVEIVTAIDAVVVVGDVDLAAHEDVIPDFNMIVTTDMYIS